MCYSKEVQLITSLIILSSSLFYYFYYSHKFKPSSQKWLLPFLNNVLLVFAAIGLHQFFEFLSLLTNNQIIYKIGLIISLSSMYFMLRSLEILLNKNIYSRLALLLIVGIAIHTFIAPMTFASKLFYLQHNSIFIWASAYILLFMYWHICALKSLPSLKDDSSKRTLLIYLLAVADISFILSTIYVIIGYFYFSVNVCTDSPSIWCTFFVLQVFFIPFFLNRLPHLFKRNKQLKNLTFKEVLQFLLLSLILLSFFIFLLPFFKCLTWKFVFP